MITGLLIPQDTTVPLSEKPFDGLADYQAAVGGYIEAVSMPAAKLTLYANEEGKVRGLEINRRATSLWWLLAPEASGLDVLVGDVIVIGSQRGRNSSTELPPDFRELLLNTSDYKYEVRFGNGKEWRGNKQRFDSYFEAAINGISMLERWTDASEVRVVAA
jgi:hypothetical protein